MDFPHIFDVDIRRLINRVAQPSSNLDPVPIFQDGNRSVRLYQGDAMQLLAQTGTESMDLIIADPPYFLSSGGMTCHNGKRVCVDKGAWDKPTTLEDMHDFNTTWLAECKRILKPHGAIWAFGTMHNIFSVGFSMQTLRYKILNDISWHKVAPPLNLSCRYFTHATETVLWARRDRQAQHVFNYEVMRQENDDQQMSSLWYIRPPRQWEKRHGKHPTQKPEALIERMIRASTNPGDAVLDPFSGSGTTGVVCARLGRRFVGFEQDVTYNTIAIKRLADECTPHIRPEK